MCLIDNCILYLEENISFHLEEKNTHYKLSLVCYDSQL